MFTIECPRHGARVLLSARRLRIFNTPSGPLVAYRCYCGHEAVELVGRPWPDGASTPPDDGAEREPALPGGDRPASRPAGRPAARLP